MAERRDDVMESLFGADSDGSGDEKGSPARSGDDRPRRSLSRSGSDASAKDEVGDELVKALSSFPHNRSLLPSPSFLNPPLLFLIFPSLRSSHLPTLLSSFLASLRPTFRPIVRPILPFLFPSAPLSRPPVPASAPSTILLPALFPLLIPPTPRPPSSHPRFPSSFLHPSPSSAPLTLSLPCAARALNPSHA
ncbi:unnamed protein product [Closterium sp. NIES-65]|nr:unnamed protein product [Closterium sp. NIES-65]